MNNDFNSNPFVLYTYTYNEYLPDLCILFEIIHAFETIFSWDYLHKLSSAPFKYLIITDLIIQICGLKKKKFKHRCSAHNVLWHNVWYKQTRIFSRFFFLQITYSYTNFPQIVQGRAPYVISTIRFCSWITPTSLKSYVWISCIFGAEI